MPVKLFSTGLFQNIQPQFPLGVGIFSKLNIAGNY